MTTDEIRTFIANALAPEPVDPRHPMAAELAHYGDPDAHLREFLLQMLPNDDLSR